MAGKVSKRVSVLLGLLLTIDATVALGYLWVSIPHIMFTSWVLAGSNCFARLFC